MLSKHERSVLLRLINSDPVEWMEEHFYIPDPRDPITGEQLPAGPIRLAAHQKKIVRHAFTKVDGKFPYATVLYSTIKKSGKTRLAAAIAAWFAATQGDYNEVYCLANDGKQSADRILSAIKQAVRLSPTLNWYVTKTRIELPNGTFIEAIPCDPSGQAGSNPGLTVWSELWGYRHEQKARLWSEMTIPPTRFGQAVRLVESYAGYTGESTILQQLYELGAVQGGLHPAFVSDGIPVYTNQAANMLCYWDEGDAARRMPWQTEAYYEQEASVLRPAEFDRIHRNQWIDPVTKAIPMAWWDACEDGRPGISELPKLPPLCTRIPVVVGLDASVSKDCCAMVTVSRHPNNALHRHVAARRVRVWKPPQGGKIDLTETMEKALRYLVANYNVVEVDYDEYQLHKMVTDLRRELPVKFYNFPQGRLRAVADNQLLDMVIRRELHHAGQDNLRRHVDNAAAKSQGDKIRFVKPDTSVVLGTTQRPIDALVATSMASYRCLELNLPKV